MYDVTFPLFAKIVVKGTGLHPLYEELTRARPEASKLPGSDFRASRRTSRRARRS